MPDRNSGRVDLVNALALLWLAGVALRSTILALPPVLPSVTADLQLSPLDIGVLTSLPPLLFALAAIPGAILIARLGALPALILGLVFNGLGAAARGLAGNTLALEAATFLMCFGVAVMQPALPPLVRTWTPGRVGFATAIYTSGLLVGEVLPPSWVPRLTLPLIGGGWRASLAFWAVPVFAIALVIGALARRSRVDAGAAAPRWWPDWGDARVWRLGLLLGGVNAAYFGVNGFMPGWLSAHGATSLVRPALIALNLAQIPASLVMLSMAERLLRNRTVYVTASVALMTSIAGIVMMPGPFAVGWAALFGFASAVMLTLGLALPATLGDEADVPRLSAGVFTVSYGFAMAMALLGGLLPKLGVTPAIAFLPFELSALMLALLGATLKADSLRKD